MSEVKDLLEIRSFLEDSLKAACPPLKVNKQGPNGLEVTGTKEVMQGKQKVAGHYFASTVEKPKDIRFYFFPIYTDPEIFSLSEGMQKMLKGKSCFHIKRLDDSLKAEVQDMIAKGIKRMQEKELI